MSSPADQISDLYERNAANYDADRGKSLTERAWLDHFRSAMPPGGGVLDLGCGSGEPIARYLIENGHALTGVDSSAGLIALCRDRFPDSDWWVGDMRRLALGQRFDGVIAWDSFFHLSPDDQRAMFAVFQAHAAPGAVMMFTSGPGAAEVIGAYRGEPLYHASLDTSEYRDLLEAHGFQVLRHRIEDPDCGGHTIWLAKFSASA